MSVRKYATTAMSVPRWSETSNVWLKASCSFRYSQSASHGTRIRCPDDEIGRLRRALHEPEHERLPVRERIGASPTPNRVSTTAAEKAAPAVIQTAARPTRAS